MRSIRLARYPMKSRNPNAQILDALLSDVSECAERAGIRLWLECGTLLGFVRDSDYIPWEADLDFGARAEEIDDADRTCFVRSIQARGYRVELFDSHWHVGLPESECHADVNIYTFGEGTDAIVPLTGPGNSGPAKAMDALIRILTDTPLGVPASSTRLRDRWKHRLKRASDILPRPLRQALSGACLRVFNRFLIQDISWVVPKRLLDGFRATSFRGTPVQVPESAETYLAYRYGDDWTVARRQYNTWKEDGAILRS